MEDDPVRTDPCRASEHRCRQLDTACLTGKRAKTLEGFDLIGTAASRSILSLEL